MNKRVIGLTLLVVSMGVGATQRAHAGVTVHEKYGSNRVERDWHFDRIGHFDGARSVRALRLERNERFVIDRRTADRLGEKDRLAGGDRSPTRERLEKLDRPPDLIERRGRIDVAEKVERYEITYLT